MTLVETFCRHLQLYGLHDVFSLVMNKVDPTVGTATKKVDVLSEYYTPTVSQVQAWSKYLYEVADSITIENLHLSQILLLNSCDDELFAKVNSQISMMDRDLQSGPSTFMLIAQNIVATTEKTVRTFTQHLQKLLLNQFPNEDVDKCAAGFTAGAKPLQAAGHMPKDIRMLAYDGVTSGSVFKFTNSIEILFVTKSSEVDTWEKTLQVAQIKFRELLAEDLWLTTKKQGSTFQAINNGNKNHNNLRGITP